MTTHRSFSAEQNLAETELLLELERALGAKFALAARLPGDLGVSPDGVDPEKKIVVGVIARIGRLKAAQVRKVRSDILKLAFIRHALGADWRAVFCFADEAAAASMLGKAWAVRAAAAFGVEIIVLRLSAETEARVVAAQNRQYMGNQERI